MVCDVDMGWEPLFTVFRYKELRYTVDGDTDMGELFDLIEASDTPK